MQARWDWADATHSGKWGVARQVYRQARPFIIADEDGPFSDGMPVVVTRNKVRGRGRALSLKFECQPGEDAHILGWSINFDITTD